MMTTFPPGPDAQVTLANWRTAPFNRWAFHHVSEIVPSAVIKNDPDARRRFGAGASLNFPSIDQPDGVTGFSDFFAATHTDGLVILHNGALVHESYANGMTASDPHICMSVSKSMLGLLAGTLAKSGDLDLSSNAATYIPELTQTAFANATVQQLLDMRTGVTFDEDYLATAGPIIEYRKSTNWNPLEPGQSPTDLRSFLLTLVETDGPHGGRFDYKSPCTDLLGWVIERATGRRFADLFSDLIWKPMGAETPAAITVDRLGAPRTAGGMSITTRDLARVGQMVCEGGWGIVPEDWINDIVENGDPDAWAHGSFAEEFSGLEMHYRSKWYVLRGKDPVLFCLGIHGQNLLVDRKAQVVLARHASGPDPLDLRSEKLTIKLFEAVRNRLGRS